MTALGIEVTDRRPTIGWEAIKPTRRRTSPELIEAERKFEHLNAEHLAMCDRLERGEAIDYDMLHELSDQVTAAEKLVLLIKHNLNSV